MLALSQTKVEGSTCAPVSASAGGGSDRTQEPNPASWADGQSSSEPARMHHNRRLKDEHTVSWLTGALLADQNTHAAAMPSRGQVCPCQGRGRTQVFQVAQPCWTTQLCAHVCGHRAAARNIPQAWHRVDAGDAGNDQPTPVEVLAHQQLPSQPPVWLRPGVAPGPSRHPLGSKHSSQLASLAIWDGTSGCTRLTRCCPGGCMRCLHFPRNGSWSRNLAALLCPPPAREACAASVAGRSGSAPSHHQHMMGLPGREACARHSLRHSQSICRLEISQRPGLRTAQACQAAG